MDGVEYKSVWLFDPEFADGFVGVIFALLRVNFQSMVIVCGLMRFLDTNSLFSLRIRYLTEWNKVRGWLNSSIGDSKSVALIISILSIRDMMRRSVFILESLCAISYIAMTVCLLCIERATHTFYKPSEL